MHMKLQNRPRVSPFSDKKEETARKEREEAEAAKEAQERTKRNNPFAKLAADDGTDTDTVSEEPPFTPDSANDENDTVMSTPEADTQEQEKPEPNPFGRKNGKRKSIFS